MVQNTLPKPSQSVGIRPQAGSGGGVRPHIKKDNIYGDQQNTIYVNDKIKAFEVIVITEE